MNEVKEVFVGVIVNSGKYLVLKRNAAQKYDPGRWEFVSMLVKAADGVARLEDRIKKETGLKPDFIKEGQMFRVHDQYGAWLVRPFLFESESEVVIEDSDHTDFKWVKKSEIANLDTVKDLAKNLDGFGDKKRSAGLLLYRFKNAVLEVLLAHPGGPFWKNKDVWGIPKGEYDEDENSLLAAKREFSEELSLPAPDGEYLELESVKISSGKIIKAWAKEADLDLTLSKSNTIFIDWPPRSANKLEIPEVDKVCFMAGEKALTKMHKGQEKFIIELAQKLDYKLNQTKAEQSSLF